jgi:hypothetical protein
MSTLCVLTRNLSVSVPRACARGPKRRGASRLSVRYCHSSLSGWPPRARLTVSGGSWTCQVWPGSVIPVTGPPRCQGCAALGVALQYGGRDRHRQTANSSGLGCDVHQPSLSGPESDNARKTGFRKLTPGRFSPRSRSQAQWKESPL